jgi:hypothetical protein
MTPIARTLAVLLLLSIGLGALMALRWREAEMRADATMLWAHTAFDSAGKAASAAYPTAADFEELGPLAKLADPVAAVRDSVRAHRELIPYPGVEGGTMGYYDPKAVQMLPPHYAFATFDDGHIGGYMLLSFRVPESGPIVWHRLWAERE